MKKIVIATIKSWNIQNANKLMEEYKGRYDILLIDNNSDLLLETLDKFKPDFIFFTHWSWKIKREIYDKYTCIVFHTSKLPNGRGGSPIQNQIIRKMYDSNVCAIRVVDQYDQGDIYGRREISLRNKNLNEILKDISDIIFKQMIPEIIEGDITPAPQMGEGSYFDRRTPEMSDLLKANIADIQDIYDFIRMLDGEGYPKAYIEVGNCRIEFSNANFSDGKLVGSFEVDER